MARTFHLLIALLVLTEVHSLGRRSFGELCSFGGHVTSFFNRENEERTCDSDKGLLCTGTCSCPPGKVWDTSLSFFGGSMETGRGCVGAVGRPCFGSGRHNECVSNAQCHYSICRCKPKFRPNGGHCSAVIGSEPAVLSPSEAGFQDFSNTNNNNNGGDNESSDNNNNNADNPTEAPNNYIRPGNNFNNHIPQSVIGDDNPFNHIRPSHDAYNDYENSNNRIRSSQQSHNRNDNFYENPNNRIRPSGGGSVRFEE